IEDTLKHLYVSEVTGVVPSIQSVAGAVRLTADEAAEVLQGLQNRRLIAMEPDGIRLTAPGRELGLNVLRAHRLWESYLADHTGFPEAEWHGRADHLEHGLSPAEVDALSAKLQHPTHDPHGDPIPTAEGEFSGQPGVPLTAAPLNRPLCILHVEDEPEAVYAKLVVLGIHPGMPVRILETSPHGIRLAAGGAEHLLDPLMAANITVTPLVQGEQADEPAGEPLSALLLGEAGRVLSISRRCRGQERRRLLDLGVLPGTVIRAEMRSPNGDPTAYRIRDALIALRAEQAEVIRIQRLSQATALAA
ncbi:MAG: iron dependent repressor, metal binding and dimerization domain protein, partial [Candidatus Methylomirabilota bacterium]